MKAKAIKLAYKAPETSVDVIETEQCFLESNLRDFDRNVIFEEDFEED